MAVRPVEPGDFAGWKELWDGYNAFYGRVGPTALAGEVVRTTWARFFDGHEPVHALVAERARAGGAQRLYWQTHESNATAMKLYDRVAEKSGFVVYRVNL